MHIANFSLLPFPPLLIPPYPAPQPLLDYVHRRHKDWYEKVSSIPKSVCISLFFVFIPLLCTLLTSLSPPPPSPSPTTTLTTTPTTTLRRCFQGAVPACPAQTRRRAWSLRKPAPVTHRRRRHGEGCLAQTRILLTLR